MRYATLLSLILGIFLNINFTQANHVEDKTPMSPDKVNCVSAATITLLQADTCGKGGVAFVNHNGTGPLTFIWSADPTINNDTITGLNGGQIYTVQVRDTNGCLASDAIFVPFISTFEGTGFTTPDTCLNGNGTAGLLVGNITGGVPPFSYQWDANTGNQTGQIATGLSTGSYLLTITDDEGCQFNWLAIVDSTNNGFNVGFDFDNVSCFGQNDAQAVVRPRGGNSNYSISWLDSDSTVLGMDTLVTGLQQGTYFVRVEDGGGPGCIYLNSFTVTEPDTLTAGFLTTPAEGCTSPDGTLTGTALGGTQPYRYIWETGDSTRTIDSLAAGTYLLTVLDTNGCTAMINGLVTSRPGPIFTVDILQQDNCGLGEGIARVNVSQGTAPFLYDWSVNPPLFNDTSQYAYNLLRGSSYNVIVTDADSCVQIRTFDMPGNEPLSIADLSVRDSYCELNNGQASISIQGGSQPYIYSWTTNPQQSSSIAQNLGEGVYTINVRDSFNCVITDTIRVIDEPGFTLEVTHTDESCFGREDGTAEAIVSGARGNVSYTWETDPIQRGPSVSRLSEGVYNLEVIDEEGCLRRSFVVIESEDFIRANFRATPDTLDPVVLSSATFRFLNNSEGGASYFWDFGDGNQSGEFNPSHTYADTGSYFVQLKAINADSSCIDSLLLGPYVVTADGQSFAASAFTPNQDGFNDFFEIKGTSLQNFTLAIYNKWGVSIFESNDPSNSWDGNLRSGSPAPEGVYIYRLEADLPGGKKIEELGTVTLVR
ncbi:MAG: gliding motility-associated C-terminal domain-containing protein [Bacteroidia bacterium]|nr:gliding motility-associated C-terminal domain-containing protein [Bacteroidia bacterium]